ncbi:efflux RND transporter permease subunit [Aliiglaciecola sp. 3_MG-2023]|uniref:efflux RND transporter permease subunit n=1 Tax=Aliiglaciecola sp. 3_MG-2023 TaxID=3062644 RepID=UPI0026E1C655|nr:efflux RND transporter permease subunit [Aliiglaciecola sp. 3_MG-2023]MDO6694714.1 efflux RND transporter permease subunit [Aliiglaciecola sp. 3_MG-2023]
MLSNLIRLSLSQRIFILLMAIGVMLIGIVSWMNIPIDAFPDISPTQVKVILKAPGMTAEEIEAQVTLPLETELLGIPNQQILRSTTKYAITDITLDFVEGTDIYWARQQVAERLNNIWSSLPSGLEGGIAPMSTPLSEMFMFSLENPQLSLLERRQILEWEIRPLLRTIDGVADVNILGGYAKTYQITPDPVKLASLGLTLNQLAQHIQANNLNGNIGRLDIGNDALIIRGEGRIDTLDQLRNMLISNHLQQSIRLSNVADVSVGHLTRYGAVTRNGQETTEAIVISLKNANTAKVIEGVSEKLKLIEKTLPAGSQINVFYNRKNLIDTAIGTIQEALLIAVILVIIVLTLFLGNIRAALVVSMILPLAALSTFWLMNSVNMSANLMSLGGLVIAIGMLVDASVVIVENVVNQLSNKNHLPKLHLVFRACKDVAVPVVSGTIIVIIVFSPLLTLTGLEGKLFKPVAITIVFAMFCALLLSLTVIPALASILIKQHDSGEPSFVTALKAKYRSTLSTTLNRPAPLIIGILLALIVSAVQFVYLGKTFMPVLDEGDIIVQLEKTPNITLNASTALDIQIQNALLEQVPEISQIVARVGADEIGLDPMSLNETDIFMELIPQAQWRFSSKSELVDSIRNVLKQFPGINFGFTQPIQMRVSEMLTGSTGDVSIKVFGEDLTELAHLASRIAQLTKSTSGSVDVNTAVTEGGEFLNIRLKPEIAQRYDMSITELSNYLRSQFETFAISEIIQGKRKTPIVFAASASSALRPGTLHEIKNNLILLPDASLVPLQDIAEISFKQGPILVERENSNRYSVVTTNVSGRDIVGFVEELKKTLTNTLELPSGYVLSFGGEFENQQRATNNLMMVVPISLLLILIILFTTFGSLAKSSLILVNIPFAVMGGIFALFISGQYLSVPASVGFIALLGIAVLNGVVMVSYFEQTKMEFNDTLTRVIDGATRRLRPVLMTAMTAMFGLAPLVFASGPGAEIQKPLAIVVIGGLFTSTLTTLYLLPVLYKWMETKNG